MQLQSVNVTLTHPVEVLAQNVTLTNWAVEFAQNTTVANVRVLIPKVIQMGQTTAPAQNATLTNKTRVLNFYSDHSA